MKTKDLWFRGIELDYDMDGTVFLLDWSGVGSAMKTMAFTEPPDVFTELPMGTGNQTNMTLLKNFGGPREPLG